MLELIVSPSVRPSMSKLASSAMFQSRYCAEILLTSCTSTSRLQYTSLRMRSKMKHIRNIALAWRDPIRTSSYTRASDGDPIELISPHQVSTRRVTRHRHPADFVSQAHQPPHLRSTMSEWDWEEDEIEGPDVEDRQTLLELAKMTNNAYLEPGEAGWYELSGEWNVVSDSCQFLCMELLSGMTARPLL